MQLIPYGPQLAVCDYDNIFMAADDDGDNDNDSDSDYIGDIDGDALRLMMVWASFYKTKYGCTQKF